MQRKNYNCYELFKRYKKKSNIIILLFYFKCCYYFYIFNTEFHFFFQSNRLDYTNISSLESNSARNWWKSPCPPLHPCQPQSANLAVLSSTTFLQFSAQLWFMNLVSHPRPPSCWTWWWKICWKFSGFCCDLY